MANKKINDLTPVVSISDTMQFETDIGGAVANKVTASQVKSYITGGIDLSNMPTSDQKDALDNSSSPLSATNPVVGQSDLAAYALDSNVVHITGVESITGGKSFTAKTIFSDAVNLNSLTANGLLATDATKNIVNISGLPDGTTAITQATSDNSTKVATNEFVKNALSSATIDPILVSLYVNCAYTGSLKNGSLSCPFTSIMDAVNSIPDAVSGDSAGLKKIYCIFVYGGQYDESIVVPPAKSPHIICLIALGSVYLGSSTGSFFDTPVTPRNIEWRLNKTVSFSTPVRPTFSLLAITPESSVSTHLFYGKSAWRVTGNLLIGDTTSDGNTSSTEHHWENVIVDGTVGLTADSHNMGTTNIVLYGCRFKGAFNLPYTGSPLASSNLNMVKDCYFEGLLTVSTIGNLINSYVAAGFSINNSNSNFKPSPAIINTQINGAISSLSAATYYIDTLSTQISGTISSTNITLSTSLPSWTVATTQTAGDSSTKVSTTEFVGTAVSNAVSGLVSGTFSGNKQITYSNGANSISGSTKYVIDDTDTNASKINIISPNGTKLAQISVDQLLNTSKIHTDAQKLELWSNGVKAATLDATQNLSVVGAASASNLSGTNTGDETNATIKTKLGASSASNDGYLTSSDYSLFKSVSGLSPLEITSPQAGQVLGYNGTYWVNSDKGALVGNGISFYLTNTSLISSGTQSQYAVKEMTKTPSLSASVEESITVNNSSDIIMSFLYKNPIQTTTISGGSWQETIWRKVSDIAGNSYIKTGVYLAEYQSTATISISGTGTTRTATATNTPFIAGDANSDIMLCSYLMTPNGLFKIIGYTSSSSVTIATPSTYVNESGVIFYKWKRLLTFTTESIETTNITLDWVDPINTSTINTNYNDEIGVIFFGQTTNTSNTVISFVHGNSTTDTYFVTPLVTGHNQLPGVQGGDTGNNDVQHLTTAQVGRLPSINQKAAMDNASTPDATNHFATMNDLSSIDVPQSKVVFRSQAGDDLNDGTTINKSIYSLIQGINIAQGHTPSNNNQWSVVSFDAGYDSNIYITPYIHVVAPAMLIMGTNTIQDSSKIHVREFNGSGSQSLWFTGGAGVNISYIKAERLFNGFATLDANQGIRVIDIDIMERTSSVLPILQVYSGSTAIVSAKKIVGTISLDGTTSYVDLRTAGDITGVSFSYTNGATSAQVKYKPDSSASVLSFNGRLGAVAPQSGDYTASLVGLGNVTNNAQTQASVVPNTAPTAAQFLMCQSAGSYAPTTLTGAVSYTSAGVGSLAANAVTTTSITNSNVTYAKIQNEAANTVLGNSSASAAAPAEIPFVSTATATSAMRRDASVNSQINHLSQGIATTATAGGTTTLTVTSAPQQQFTGTLAQTVILPNATTLTAGFCYVIMNRSTGAITVNANGGSNLTTVAPNTNATLRCVSIGTAAGTWNVTPSLVNITFPSPGQLAIGNSATTGYAPQTVSGAIGITSNGVTSLNAGVVALSNHAALAANSVIGNLTGSAATPTAASVSVAASSYSLVLRDTLSNAYANNFINKATVTATSGRTTTLNPSSSMIQQFTGTLSHTIILPDATALTAGYIIKIINSSTNEIFVQYSGAGTNAFSILSNGCATCNLVVAGTAAGTWYIEGSQNYNWISQAMTLTGPINNVAMTLYIRPDNDMVDIEIPNVTITGNNTSAIYVSSAAVIPAQFRPVTDYAQVLTPTYTGQGLVEINTAGFFKIFYQSSSSFPAFSTTGFLFLGRKVNMRYSTVR